MAWLERWGLPRGGRSPAVRRHRGCGRRKALGRGAVRGRLLPAAAVVAAALVLAAGGVAAGSGDPIQALLEELPRQPPGLGPGGSGQDWPGYQALIDRAAERVPESLWTHPFWVLGASLPRVAVYASPPPPDDVRFLLPLIAVRNPRYPSDDEELWYSVLGELSSSGGVSLPASAVRIHTLHGASGDSVAVLPAGHRVGIFWIGIRGEVWAEGDRWRPAGTYAGVLVPNRDGVPEIPFRVRLERYVEVDAPDRILFQAPTPGFHVSELRLSYQTNVPVVLTAEVEAPTRVGGGSGRKGGRGSSGQEVLPLERLEYAVNGIWEPVGEYPFPLPLDGAVGLRRTATFPFRLRTTWEEAAGEYVGEMWLTVLVAAEADP